MLIKMSSKATIQLLPGQSYLVMMDMDSTLICNEVIDDLAAAVGVGDEVKAITNLAMSGSIDFAESLRRRVGLLQGADEKILVDIKNAIKLTPGAEELISKFKELGFKTCVVSGGFDVVIKEIIKKLKIDDFRANKLEVVNGKLTGNLLGEILDANGKKETLIQMAKKFSIPLSRTIAIGDGANDIPMIEQAAIGIAFNGKNALEEKANLQVHDESLLGVLSVLGLSSP